eukprot:1159208-Pelagomonas_calceolata.AAC.14
MCEHCGRIGHRCCTCAAHGVAPAVPASAPRHLHQNTAHLYVCANQPTPAHAVLKQTTSIEDSGKLCNAMYIISTETQHHRKSLECRSSAPQEQSRSASPWLTNIIFFIR